MKRCAFLLGVVFLLNGCTLLGDNSAGRVSVTTDQEAYFLGQTATLTVENSTRATVDVVAITHCTTQLEERLASQEWGSVEVTPDLACALVRLGTSPLRPGETLTGTFPLTLADPTMLADSAPDFRLSVGVVMQTDDFRHITSNTFQINLPRR